MGFIIALVVIALLVYFITPLSFGRLPLEGEYQVKITVNGRELTATMENSRPSMAFKRLLGRRGRTVRMRDYGGMEKVGMLFRRLPAEDRQITTAPGDIILFMSMSLVVYYKPNSWNFTRLGHIDGVSAEELTELLGKDRVNMHFELLK